MPPLDESLKANAELASRNVLLEQEEKAEQSAENEPPENPHPGGLPVTRIASMRYGAKGDLIAHSPSLEPGSNLIKGINLKKNRCAAKAAGISVLEIKKLRCFCRGVFEFRQQFFNNAADSTQTQKVTMIVAMERKQADRRFL